MPPKPKKQVDADEAPKRQLGLGFASERAADGGRSKLPAAPALPIAPVTSVVPAAPDAFAPAGGFAGSGTLVASGAFAAAGTLVASGLPGTSVVPAASSLEVAAPIEMALSTEIARTPRVFAVAELVRAARLTLEGRFGEVRVDGEVSGFKRSGPGHLYFSLKDAQAALDCVMYARDAVRLRFAIQDGMAVRLRGRLTIYEGRGRFQMSVVEIEPQGAGALAIAFEQLKQKLEAAGLFAAARKRPLPFLPRRLGVVTSAQGAVFQDIIRVAHRRFPVSILLAPTPVQGPGAVAGIVGALGLLGRVPDVDVIILARGGGSLEDLWSFNEEEVAHAIAACPVPVISAIGHETDFTIADFVADLRAPTPSAAAELAVPVMTELRAQVMQLGERAARGTTVYLRQSRLVLERARARISDPRRLFDERRQMLDELGARAHRLLARRVARNRADLAAAEVALSRAHPHRRIATQRAVLAEMAQILEAVARRALQRRRVPFDGLAHKLDALSPRRVLDRGYSLAFGADGHLLTDAAAARPGDRIRVSLKRGEIAATVTDHAPSSPFSPSSPSSPFSPSSPSSPFSPSAPSGPPPSADKTRSGTSS